MKTPTLSFEVVRKVDGPTPRPVVRVQGKLAGQVKFEQTFEVSPVKDGPKSWSEVVSEVGEAIAVELDKIRAEAAPAKAETPKTETPSA